MKSERDFPQMVVNKKAQRSIEAGHPWVYGAEIVKMTEPLPENGSVTDVVSESGKYLGSGLYSAKSKITVRLLTRNASIRFGDDFWARRVSYAVEYRRRIMGEHFTCCRLIFGEADGFPGLTVDRFGDYLVTEVLSYGINKVKSLIYGALLDEIPGIRGIYERNESQIRLLEGLPQCSGWAEDFPNDGNTSTVITENGIRYNVDFAGGQKTGFFLDQKFNRQAVSRISSGLRVLDCCTHTGSFALNALAGGASHVTAMDVSSSAIEMASRNAALNGFSDRIDFVCEDVFDLLPKIACLPKGNRYDMIVLDPPAFTKSSRTLSNAQKGYREINYLALKAIPRGGFFATCSCSHFMTTPLFLDMLKNAASDAGVELKILEIRHQSPDHPILLNVPETDYLKFVLAQVQ